MYTTHVWQSENHFNFKYVKYLPEGYDESKKYPLVFFLHGAGERGDDPELAVRNGYMKNVRDEGKKYPFIMIAPQCPQGKYWGCFTESLLAFLDWIEENLPVDKKRIYLSGISMGGTGTWMLGMAAPDRFAALFPVCGSGIYWYGGILKDVPIYTYHGDNDTIVPVTDSINMVASVNKHGGNAKIKIVYGKDHDVWDDAYSDGEILDWLLSQKKE